MKAFKKLVLSAVLAFGGTGLAMAQPDKMDAKPATAKMLDAEDLGTMLDTMGYEYTVTESEDKSTKWYNVKINRKELGGTFQVSLALSPNKKKIWGHVSVTQLNEENMANAEVLTQLLEQNATIGPNHFRLDAKTKYLYISRCTDNRGLTAVLIREHIENLVDSCVSTKDTWMKLATKSAKNQ